MELEVKKVNFTFAYFRVLLSIYFHASTDTHSYQSNPYHIMIGSCSLAQSTSQIRFIAPSSSLFPSYDSSSVNISACVGFSSKYNFFCWSQNIISSRSSFSFQSSYFFLLVNSLFNFSVQQQIRAMRLLANTNRSNVSATVLLRLGWAACPA